MQYRVLLNKKSELEGSRTVGWYSKETSAVKAAYKLAKDYYIKRESANIYVCKVLNDKYNTMSYELTYSVHVDDECRAIYKYLKLSEHQEKRLSNILWRYIEVMYNLYLSTANTDFIGYTQGE